MAKTMQAPGLLEGERPGVALMERVREALANAGLPRVSPLAGAELAGFISPDHFGSTGFSVTVRRPTPKQPSRQLTFNIVTDGKATGLDYREYPEYQGDDDVIDCHEPREGEMERLHPKIRQVFKELGFRVRKIRNGGYQTHWDFDIEFTVVTDIPAPWEADVDQAYSRVLRPARRW